MYQANTVKLPEEFIKPAARFKAPTDNVYFVGVDGGATKTLAMVCNAAGTKIAIGSAGPSNQEAVGFTASIAAVKAAIDAAIASMCITVNDIDCAVCSVSGITLDSDAQKFKNELRELKHVYVHNDVIAAWASGTMCAPGVAVIAGTGSNTIGVNADGVSCRAGGWGHILGDEGAGYCIGLTTIREALRSYDSRIPETPLLQRLLTYFAIASPDGMFRLMYREPVSKDTIAAFAICAAEEASAGDPVSRAIFCTAGHELGLAAAAVSQRLDLHTTEFPVALIGSVFRSKELILPSLEETLYATAPKAHPVFPKISPAAGSVVLAVRAAGAWDTFNLNDFINRVSQKV